jgi:hypothetical protein
MRLPLLANTQHRIGLIAGFFFLSVATVITVRAISPVLLGYDTCALVECAVRYSKTGVASSALFPGFTEVITDPHPYPELRWWATGAPKIMGSLIRLGFSPEAAYRVVHYAAITLMWLGWFCIVRESGKLHLLSQQPLIATGFCLSPLFLTPFIDIDEMLFAAFVPWVIFLTLKTCFSRRWWLYLGLLVMAFLASYQCRHVSLLFPLLAMSAYGIVLLRAQETKHRKLTALTCFVVCLGVFLALFYVNRFSEPDYLSGEAPEQKADVIQRFFEAVKYSGYTSLFWTVNWFVPGKIVGFYEEKLMTWQLLGFFSLPLFCILAAVVIYKSLCAKTFNADTLAVFSGVLVLLINYAVLIYASIKTQGEFIHTGFSAYWYPYLPLVIFLAIFIFREGSILKAVLARAVSVILLASVVTMIVGLNNKAFSNLRGYYFDGQEMLNQRLSFVQRNPVDFILPRELLQSSAVLYTQAPQFYSLMYPDSRLQFRPPASRSEFLKYRTNQPVTLYFSLNAEEREKGFMGLGILNSAIPSRENLFFEDIFSPLSLTEMSDFPLQEFLVNRSYNMHLFKVDLPAGWRGKDVAE